MPRIVKWLLGTVVVAVAVVVLFLWVFPWVESLQQDPTMGRSAGGSASASPTTLQELRSPR